MNLTKIRTAWQTANDFGLGWTMRRLYYEFQLRTGHHKRRFPKRSWQQDEVQQWLAKPTPSEQLLEHWRSNRPAFFFDMRQRSAIADAMRQLTPGLSVTADIYRPRYFSKTTYDIQLPDIWFSNPFREPRPQCAPDLHWSEYPMYTAEYEDLKFIWEYGRFAVVYDLVRAYTLTGDEALAEQFWLIVLSWIEHNPPNTGPHWKCGQETSLRLMAWYVGLFAFIDAPATTPERFALFMGAVAAQAQRVASDWRYSYLQQSNHAVSEGLGLYVTGLLFPQFKDAAEWQKTGKFILEERATFLFRPDGTYFQKSHNYLRFIIHAYMYVMRVAEANGDSLTDVLKDRMRAALHYLTQVIDEKSGYTPNFGSNDGALILPFNSCDYRDFRPTVAMLHYYFHQERIFAAGAWHEDLIWLFSTESLAKPTAQLQSAVSSRFDHSGIYTLRSQNSWGFTHAESFTDRPAHADALHLDLWWRGINICCDPGTYLYYGHAPWFDAFKHTRFHNTITVDDKDQMERAYRFTWGYWHTAQLNDFQKADDYQLLEVEHHGYHRLTAPVTHRRSIIAINDYWLVIDDLLGAASHQIGIHWLLAHFPFQNNENHLLIDTPEGNFEVGIHHWNTTSNEVSLDALPLNIHKGDKTQNTSGLHAFYYGDIAEAISVNVSFQGVLAQRFITCLGAEGWQLSTENNSLQLSTPEQFTVLELNLPGQGTIVNNIKQQ
ncbi:MAG: alginate lyase family protein [Bacteroidota bacterium]